MEWCEGVKYNGLDKGKYRKTMWYWVSLHKEMEKGYVTEYMFWSVFILDQNNISFSNSLYKNI